MALSNSIYLFFVIFLRISYQQQSSLRSCTHELHCVPLFIHDHANIILQVIETYIYEYVHTWNKMGVFWKNNNNNNIY